MNEKFKIKSYGWQELAVFYAPGITPHSATKRLAFWVFRNPQLYQKMQETGWKKKNKILTPEQVRILVYFLGEP